MFDIIKKLTFKKKKLLIHCRQYKTGVDETNVATSATTSKTPTTTASKSAIMNYFFSQSCLKKDIFEKNSGSI